LDATVVKLTIEPPHGAAATVPARRHLTRMDSEDVHASGEIMHADIGSPDAMCDRVIVHFTNLPRMHPAEYLVDNGHYWAGRWTCSGAGWQLVLDVRQDHSRIWDAMRESLVFVVTHVGELRRTDGSSFRASEAAEALTAFQTGSHLRSPVGSLQSRRSVLMLKETVFGSNGLHGAVVPLLTTYRGGTRPRAKT
jgi:hypothetical protein